MTADKDIQGSHFYSLIKTIELTHLDRIALNTEAILVHMFGLEKDMKDVTIIGIAPTAIFEATGYAFELPSYATSHPTCAALGICIDKPLPKTRCEEVCSSCKYALPSIESGGRELYFIVEFDTFLTHGTSGLQFERMMHIFNRHFEPSSILYYIGTPPEVIRNGTPS